MKTILIKSTVFFGFIFLFIFGLKYILQFFTWLLGNHPTTIGIGFAEICSWLFPLSYLIWMFWTLFLRKAKLKPDEIKRGN